MKKATSYTAHLIGPTEKTLIIIFFQAYKELGLLLIVVGVVGLTFSVLVFYAEKDNKEFQWTFLDSFCWGLMTLTTGKGVSDLKACLDYFEDPRRSGENLNFVFLSKQNRSIDLEASIH